MVWDNPDITLDLESDFTYFTQILGNQKNLPELKNLQTLVTFCINKSENVKNVERLGKVKF